MMLAWRQQCISDSTDQLHMYVYCMYHLRGSGVQSVHAYLEYICGIYMWGTYVGYDIDAL